ncbi:MAG: hypothetical protein JW912_00795 [Sedimentisphaerales bacterium]|nr:hypothetical protein [Sedimentisphaerales bacterium]
MTKIHRNGFVLMFVLLLLMLIGLAMTLLSSSARTMASESSTAKLRADCENILESCTAWIDVNSKKIKKQPKNTTMELNLNELGILTAVCNITVKDTNKNGTEIEINYSSSKGRMTMQKKLNYTVK